MKERLNITIDKDSLDNAKRFASKKGISVSQLIEQYCKNLNHRSCRIDIIQLIDNLPKPKIDLPCDLKEAYYQDQYRQHVRSGANYG